MSTPSGVPIPGKQNLPGFRSAGKAPVSLRKPAIVLQPQTYHSLKTGIELVAEAVRPTLGPLPRLVALERLKRNEAPEILDDGATIARRIIQIAPRSCDVGAMLIRHALWQMHQEVGDGTATLAVIYQALVREGVRYVTQWGCNAMLLRSGLEKGVKAVLKALRQEAAPLSGQEHIALYARGLCQAHDQLADMLAEIFDIVGPEGLVVVEKWHRLGLEREYVEGAYWRLSGWFSRLLVTDQVEMRTVFEDAAILISDLEIRDPHPLVSVLHQCAKAGARRLVIIARGISDNALGLLVRNNQAKTIETLAVRTPHVGERERVASMEDIAVLTGGKIFYSAAHADFRDFRVADLGHARRAWATESLFGVLGGRGDPRRIRQHILQLRERRARAEDEREKEMLQERLGRLMGGTAILRVGGATDSETEALKSIATRAVAGIRSALSGGVVPGGGTALLNAQSALTGLPVACEEERLAFQILARALEEPLRAIAQNAGHQPDVIVEKVKMSPKGFGFDARSGRIVDMRQAGILDSVGVLEKALEIAVSGAALVLTTDAIVHHRKPQECVDP